MTEFDYVEEAQQMETVRQNLTKAGLAGKGKKCLVPKPYMEYCTKRVLVMEELRGDKLAVALKDDMRRHAEREGKSAEEFEQEMKLKVVEARERGEELMGPSAEQFDKYISILDKQRSASNAFKIFYNTLVAWLPGHQRARIENRSSLPINHAKMIDDLFYIHGHEVLVDGCFNGDPHPGNILLVREYDGNPTLGLIDYGQVKRLSKETRHLLCKLIIAMDDDNVDETIRLVQEAGLKTQNMDPHVHYLYAKVSFDQDNLKLLGGKVSLRKRIVCQLHVCAFI